MALNETEYESGTDAADSRSALSHTMDRAKEAVKHMSEELRDDAAHKAKSLISGTRESFAEDLGTLARSMRQAAQSFEERDSRLAADYAQAAACGVEKLADYLQEKDLGRIVDDVEDFARRRPAVVLGGAFAAGFFLARLFKNAARSSGRQTTRPGEYDDRFPLSVETGDGDEYAH